MTATTITFTPDSEAQFQKVVVRYPEKKAALLPALWIAQRQFGWLSEDVMAYVADRLGLFPAEVKSTATFYSMFYKKPMGRFHVQVCTNLSCYLRGSDELLHRCERRMGIHPGETTADGRFSLDYVECLGSCGTAPMMQVNDDFHEDLTFAKLDALLDQWEKA